jgi:hypothetical protein
MFSRYNRLVDFSPKSDVDRRYVVSRPSEAAIFTSKIVSVWPISFGDMAARGTSPRWLPGINKHHEDTGFVLDKA